MNLPEANARLSFDFLLLALAFSSTASTEDRASAMRMLMERSEGSPQDEAPEVPR